MQKPCQFDESRKTAMKSAMRNDPDSAGSYGTQSKDCSLAQAHAQLLCNAQEWRENNQARKIGSRHGVLDRVGHRWQPEFHRSSGWIIANVGGQWPS